MSDDIARGLINLVAISVLGLMIKQNALFSPKERRASLLAVASVIVAIVAEAITFSLAAPNSPYWQINKLFCAIGFGITPFVPFLMAVAFGVRGGKNRILYAGPAIINALLSALSPFYGFIYSYSSANEYSRGPFFPVFILASLFGMVMFVVHTLAAVRVFQNRNKGILLGIVFLTLFGASIQVIRTEIPSTWPTITLAMILAYAYYTELLEQHDVMTKLFNRRAYEKRLAQLALKGAGCAVLFDVDNFKQVNDSHGHQYGDLCLAKIAQCIRDSFGRFGFCYRIGGDEFGVLSARLDRRSLDRAVSAFEAEMAWLRAEDPCLPRVSMGHAFFGEGACGAEEALQAADRMLYLSKKRKAEKVPI